MFLTVIGTIAAFFQGVSGPYFFWIIVGMIHVYFLIVVYSLYEILEFEDEQKECHQRAAIQGYNQCGDPDFEKGSDGYHASHFHFADLKETPLSSSQLKFF